ncbi:MAG: sulfatase [Isosphaerales bacterium]
MRGQRHREPPPVESPHPHRCYNLIALIVLWLSNPAIVSAGDGHGDPAGPNLLLIVADDHGGGTLGIEGDPRQATPNLDALARQGALFERAFCNSPLCTPSRQSLITGKLPHSIGVTRLPTRLSDDVLTMGEWLHDLDYQTLAIGKMHFNGPSAHGFAVRVDTPAWERDLLAHPPRGGDHRRPWRPILDPPQRWLNASYRSTGLPTESMQSTYFVNRATEYLKGKHDRPFAMIVSFYEPHSPFNFPRGWRPRFRPGVFTAPPVSERDRREQPEIFAPLSALDVRGIQAAYYTSLSFVDAQVGRLIEALDETGLSSRTLVVYLGDNGYMLGQHGRFEKHCFYEPAVRIPLIMRWPGHLESHRRIAGLVEMIDVLPTILHLLELPVPPGLQGIDLEPLLAGKPGAQAHDVVFSEYLENEEAMVRSARYKLIVCTGRRLRQDGYQTAPPLRTPGPYMRLYDLVSDPGETRDLSDDPTHASIKDYLLGRMVERMVTTREGLEPVPAGLARLEKIHWCLVPRDRAEPPTPPVRLSPPADTGPPARKGSS